MKLSSTFQSHLHCCRAPLEDCLPHTLWKKIFLLFVLVLSCVSPLLNYVLTRTMCKLKAVSRWSFFPPFFSPLFSFALYFEACTVATKLPQAWDLLCQTATIFLLHIPTSLALVGVGLVITNNMVTSCPPFLAFLPVGVILHNFARTLPAAATSVYLHYFANFTFLVVSFIFHGKLPSNWSFHPPWFATSFFFHSYCYEIRAVCIN